MFVGRNNLDVFDKILKNDVDYPSAIEPDAKQLIGYLCDMKPRNRIGFKDIQKLKDHKFFKDIDFEKLD